MGHYSYLTLILLLLAMPIILAFKKIKSIKKKAVGLSILTVSIIYIPWEMAFTAMKIMRFNENFILGIFICNLPIEQYLINLIVLAGFLFLYQILQEKLKRNYLRITHFTLTPILILALGLWVLTHLDQTYSAIANLFLMLLLSIQIIKLKRYMSWFYLSLCFSIIPIFIIQYIIFSAPIINYDSLAFSGINFLKLPLELMTYQTGLLLLSVMMYEYGKMKFYKPQKEKLESI